MVKFFQDAWKGLVSLVSGDKFRRMRQRREEMERRGIAPPPGKRIEDMSASEIWKPGVGGLLGLATGDIAGKTERGRTMRQIGEKIGEHGINILRRLPGSQIEKAEQVYDLWRDPAKGLMQIAADQATSRLRNRAGVPSMAEGGRVARSGRVRVHKGELVVKKKAVKPLITLLKKSGVALPLSAIRAKAKKK
jgi:hypothetical protein